MVERNLAKVEVAGSSPVVRSEEVQRRLHGGVAERRGSGLQSRVHGFKSRLHLETRRLSRTGVGDVTRAIGAVVARFLDTEEVTGSNPVSPTNELHCESNEFGRRIGFHATDVPLGFALQSLKRQFTGLDAAAGGCPNDGRVGRDSWMRDSEAAQ